MKQLDKRDFLQNGVIDASIHTLNGEFEVHRHDFFEIEYILSGTGDYVIDGVRHELSAGKLFFLTPANFHTVRGDKLSLINMMFTPTPVTADALFSLTVEHSFPVFSPHGSEKSLIELLLFEILEAVKIPDNAYAMRLSATLFSKLARMQTVHSPAPIPYVKEAVLYLLSHFTEPITLPKTAKQLGLSPNYLSELFHAEVGVGFKEYLDELRLDYIAKLLIYSPLPITEVAISGGFADYANFVRRFKAKYGVSPSVWRKNTEK